MTVKRKQRRAIRGSTTLWVSTETKTLLDKLQHEHETYDDTLRRILDERQRAEAIMQMQGMKF